LSPIQSEEILAHMRRSSHLGRQAQFGDLFCPSGQHLAPKGLIYRCRQKQYTFHRLGDEVNAIQKGSKTYEASNSSIHIP
jgi:hypothetical protein